MNFECGNKYKHNNTKIYLYTFANGNDNNRNILQSESGVLSGRASARESLKRACGTGVSMAYERETKSLYNEKVLIIKPKWWQCTASKCMRNKSVPLA